MSTETNANNDPQAGGSMNNADNAMFNNFVISPFMIPQREEFRQNVTSSEEEEEALFNAPEEDDDIQSSSSKQSH
jgi:hypothetical protein